MPTYDPPTAAEVRDWTGINAAILDETDEALDDTLDVLIALAIDWVSLQVGETRFEATDMTTGQAGVLKQATAYYAAASFLTSPMVRKLTGTQEPLLMEDAQAFRDEAAALEAKAKEYAALFVASCGTEPEADATLGVVEVEFTDVSTNYDDDLVWSDA